MTLISDILLSAGAFGAAIYCFVLSARLKKFTTLENGMGSAIAVLSAQVDDMTKALDRARGAAITSAAGLEGLTGRAEQVAARIEILLASMHDLPDPAQDRPAIGEEDDDTDKKLRFVRRRPQRTTMEAAE
ncbi:MAG: hypothetical protein H7245_03740 [Candidatus Saccharibacteria bacterium]|nr:hypothetical protein [Pseudorhodobacter sp.]